MASDDNLFSFIYFFWSIVFRLVSSTISHLKEDKISFAEKYILPSKLHVFIPWKILFDLVRTHSASFDLSSADNLSRCVLKFHWTLFTPSLQIVFDHNIYYFTFKNIYLQVCLKAKNKDLCAKSKSKCNFTLFQHHMRHAVKYRKTVQITYLDSSLGFSSFLSNSDSSPPDIPPRSLPSSKIVFKALATLYL